MCASKSESHQHFINRCYIIDIGMIPTYRGVGIDVIMTPSDGKEEGIE